MNVFGEDQHWIFQQDNVRIHTSFLLEAGSLNILSLLYRVQRIPRP